MAVGAQRGGAARVRVRDLEARLAHDVDEPEQHDQAEQRSDDADEEEDRQQQDEAAPVRGDDPAEVGEEPVDVWLIGST